MSSICLLLLDEADALVLRGDEMPVTCNEIFRSLPVQKQCCAFSSTYSKDAIDTAKNYTRDPTWISVDHDDMTALRDVVEYYHEVHPADKERELINILLATAGQCVVFCNDRLEGVAIIQQLSINGLVGEFICGRQQQWVHNRLIARLWRGTDPCVKRPHGPRDRYAKGGTYVTCTLTLLMVFSPRPLWGAATLGTLVHHRRRLGAAPLGVGSLANVAKARLRRRRGGPSLWHPTLSLSVTPIRRSSFRA